MIAARTESRAVPAWRMKVTDAGAAGAEPAAATNDSNQWNRARQGDIDGRLLGGDSNLSATSAVDSGSLAKTAAHPIDVSDEPHTMRMGTKARRKNLCNGPRFGGTSQTGQELISARSMVARWGRPAAPPGLIFRHHITDTEKKGCLARFAVYEWG